MTLWNMKNLHEHGRLAMLCGALLGALIGWAAWLLVLSYSHATFIVSIGQVGPGGPSGSIGQQVKLEQVLLEDPAAFAERVKSPAFASSLVSRTGISELQESLPALQYGGRGLLSARSMRAPSQGLPNLIEVKVSSLNADIAKAAARAAVDEILQEHTKLLEPFLQAMKMRQVFLESRINSQQKTDEEIGRAMGDGSGREVSDFSRAASAGAKLLANKGALDIELTRYDARLALLTQDLRRTMVLFEPALARARRAWIVAGPLAGAISGLIFVFLAFRISREFAQRRESMAAPDAGSAT